PGDAHRQGAAPHLTSGTTSLPDHDSPPDKRRTAPAGGGGRLCGVRPGAVAAPCLKSGGVGAGRAGHTEELDDEALNCGEDGGEEAEATVDDGGTGADRFDAAHGESFRCPAVACPPPGCSSHADYTRDVGGRSVFVNHMRPRSHFRRRTSWSRALD